MKHTIKLLTLAFMLAAILTLTGCPGPVNNYIDSPVWDDGVVTKEATCTEEGVKTYTCSNGETRTETIPALGHDMGDWGDWEVVIEPTTTSVGKKVKVRTCKRVGCNHSETWEETIPMFTSDPSDTSNDDTSNDSEDTNNTTEGTQEHVHNYVGGGCDDINCDKHYKFNNEEDYQIEIRIVESSEDIDTFVTLYFSFDADNLTSYSYIEIAEDGNWIRLNDLIHMKPSYSSYSVKEIKIGLGEFVSYSNSQKSLSHLDSGSPIYIVVE